jgi:hypothetical protein
VHALLDGLTRAAAAPVVLGGTIAVLWWLRGPADARTTIAGFVVWAFLSGGILDRYARGRATRGHGFFAACGAHFAAMLRLGLIIAMINAGLHFALAARVGTSSVMVLALALLSAVALVAVYGQIRLVVEDRRSALGALVAGFRFVRRHPLSILLFLLYATAAWAAASIPALPFAASATIGGVEAPEWWIAEIGAVVVLAVVAFLLLSLYASGIALFQSKLAHAGYTAAPPLEWPDSPAAEAIANASRSTAS